MMSFPQTKQDELWRLGETVGHDRVLESLLDQYYPDRKKNMLDLSQKQGADRVLESLLTQMLEREDVGKVPGRPFERERPSRLPAAEISKQPQVIAEGRVEEPSVFERLEQMEGFEAAGRAQAGEAIAEEVAGFGRHLKKEWVDPYVETKRMLVDKPLEKLEKADLLRKGIAKMRENAVYLPSIDETKELIEARNWRALNELAEDGRLPTEDELGTDYIEGQIERLGQESAEEVRIRAQSKIMGRLFNDPSASWLRRGEVKGVGAEFIVKHPKLSLAPLILTAPAEEVARIATTPTQWDDLVLYYTTGRMVLQPATKLGAQYLSNKGWATKPITPLKSLGRKFPKKQPVSVADIQSILKADPDVGDDILRAFTKLSNAEKADIARAVKAGKPVHIATPRFRGGEPAFGQPTPERLGFGITPEQRPFYPPVPTTQPPTAPVAPPVGEPIYGVQENLPIPYEGIPTSVPAVSARPIISTVGVSKMPQKPRQQPPPAEPSDLIVAVSDPVTETTTGLSPELVNTFRRSGLSDQHIRTLADEAGKVADDIRPVRRSKSVLITETYNSSREPRENKRPFLALFRPVRIGVQNTMERMKNIGNRRTAPKADIREASDGNFYAVESRNPEQFFVVPRFDLTINQDVFRVSTSELFETRAKLPLRDPYVVEPATLNRHSDGSYEVVSKGVISDLPPTSEPAEAAAIPEIAPEPTVTPGEAIPLPGPEPVVAPEVPEPVAEKPARVIPKRSKVKKGKISVLPDKARVLAEMDAAIKKAPKRNDVDAVRRAIVGQETIKLADIITQTELEDRTVNRILGELQRAGEIQYDRQLYRATDKLATAEAGGGKLTFKMDGGTISVQNNKEALTQVRKLVAKVPLSMDAPGVTKQPGVSRTGISPNREKVGDLIKGAPEGYFTDGKIIVKGKPPKSAKFDPRNREILPETVLDMLKRPTETAELQYYAVATTEDIGVSSEPIATFAKEQTPWAIFRTGNKFVAYNQHMLNVVKKRYPDAKYGIDTSTSAVVAYDDGEPVGMIMGMKVLGNEQVLMDTPPAYTMATEAGLIEELAADTKDIAELHALGYNRGQVERLTGTTARELIADQIPAEEVIVEPDGTVKRVAGAKSPRPVTGTTEELTAENVKAQDEIRKRREEGGFLGVKRPRVRSEAKRELLSDAKKITGKDGFGDDFYESRDDIVFWENMKRKFKSIGRQTEDLIFAEANRYLVRAFQSGKYPKEVNDIGMQFERRNRTHYQTVRTKGRQIAQRDAYGVWGELDADQQERLGNLIGLQSIKNRLHRGLPEIADVTMQQARQMYTATYRKADSETRAAFHAYDKFQKAFSYQHLVDRGKLNPEHVFYFYSPHRRLNYLWGSQAASFALPEPAKPRYRGYLQRTVGSKSPFAVGLDIIEQQWGVVHSDNMYEDFMLDDLVSLDAASRQAITKELGQDRAGQLFAGMGKGDTIPVGDAKYVVTQFEPGRYHFPALVADPKLLRESMMDAVIDSDRLLSLPPDQQEELLDRYLEDVGPRGGNAIRRAIVVGRYKPLYVVPQEVGWRLRGMRQENPYIPLLREAQKMSSYWKTVTLNWAGIPYHLFQFFFVDTPMQLLTAPGSIKSMPEAFKIIRNLHKLNADPSALGPRTEETFRLALDQDTFGSGFLREYMLIRPKWTDAKTWLQALQRWGAMRESLNRIAMLDYQWHERYKKGKPFEAIHFEKRTQGYEPEQTAGYIADNFTVDFESTPDWYKSVFRGFVFPFITGAHKGSLTLARLIGKMPFKRPLRFVTGIAAPIAAVHLWNNTGWRKPIRDRLGWSGGRLYTTILHRWDDNDDGEPDRVLVWSPRTNIDEAGEWIGIDSTLQILHKLRRKKEAGILTKTDMQDAAKEIAGVTFWGTPNKLNELMNPALQFLEGSLANYDPFTKKAIMPDEVRGTPEENRYLAQYFVKKMMTPIEQLARTQKGGNIQYEGPSRWPGWARALGGAVVHGPLNVPRGLGFKVINLNNIRRSDQLNAMSELAKKRITVKKELRNEFIYNGDLRMPESLFDFHNQIQSQWERVKQGSAPTNRIGKILKKAIDHDILLDDDIAGSPQDVGSIKNMLIGARTWMLKTKYANKIGAATTRLFGTPIAAQEMSKLSDDEKRELDDLHEALGDIWVKQKLGQTPVGIRPALMIEMLPLYGLTMDDLMGALETR